MPVERSAIEWTDSTWNPVTGCTKVSPGCAHCYAERLSLRFGRDFNVVRCHPERLRVPGAWMRPRRIFVNSMSDLFHEDVPLSFIRRVFAVIEQLPLHRFQVLTKRSQRALELAPQLPWPPNLWMGVSVENRATLYRIEHLRAIPAAVRFLSLEPLLESVGPLNLEGIHWLIVGGESGPGARPMKIEWVRPLRDQCLTESIPFFLKQLGGWPSKRGGVAALLDGQTWTQSPRL